MPGPGAYKPKFSQIDAKSDRVSHTLQALDRRITYFDTILARHKETNEKDVIAELGCCERLMNNLTAVNQMTDLKQRQHETQLVPLPSANVLAR